MWISRLRALVTRLVSARRVERDLDDELRAYVDLRTEELVATGLSREDAARRARLALGGAEAVKESVRLVRTGTLIEQIWSDVRYACRGLLRAPGFTLTVVLTIGLGIGVNTAVFSVIDTTLFRPLPYEHPDELVGLGRERSGMTVPARMSWDDVARWRARTDLFQGVEISSGGRAWHWLERDEEVVVAAFTPGLPALLGIEPAMGRVFTPEEANRKAPVIMIADVLWTRAFGRRPDVLGTTMTINGRAMTIVGVMPPAFRFGPGGLGVLEAWIGMPERPDPDVPASDAVRPTFRVRSGLTRDAAQALVVEAAALMQQDLPTNARWEPRLTSFVEARRTGARGDMRPAMLMLLATAGLVLLVACVNVANLLLARGAGRSQELAMRAALGATRARVARLLLAEGVILAGLGGVVALLFATWTTALVVVLIPPEMHTRMFMVGLPGLDARVLTFAAMATTCTALLAASWPAVAGSLDRRPGHRLATGAAGIAPRWRVSRSLQSLQVGAAMVLAIIAGLLGTSFAAMLAADLGFDSDGLVALRFALPEHRSQTRDAERLAALEILERIRATPGVRRAAIGGSPASSLTHHMLQPGQREPGAELGIRTVGVGYFETAGLHLVAGRDFGPEDRRGMPRVAIIEEAGARRLFGQESPLGQRFIYHQAIPEITIIGVVETAAARDFATPNERVGMYLPEAQDYTPPVVLLRTAGESEAVLKNVRASIAALDPAIRITSVQPATAVYDEAETFSTPRFYLVLVSTFALLALVTAAVGLYGLLAHTVGHRRREIGVRMALGSTTGGIRWLVLRDALVPVAAGVAGGALVAWWAAGLIASQLYGIGPRDPRAFALASVALLLAATLAALAPVRRATGVDPVGALRAE